MVILGEILSTFLLQNAEHPRFNAQDRTKGGESIPVSVPLSYALLILRRSDVEKRDARSRSFSDESRLSYRPV